MNELLSTFAANPTPFIEGMMFYLLSAVLVFSALMVITVGHNAVHAVLFLILAFFNAAGLFILLGAEFVAMTLVIVYVGAVAVLFLFVVMMLDLDFKGLKRKASFYMPIGFIVGAIFASELIMMVIGLNYPHQSVLAVSPVQADATAALSNTEALGRILYTQYFLPFQMAGIVLLVAMIGAIVLTYHSKKDGTAVRRQKIAAQTNRDPASVLQIKKVESGKGVSQ